MKINKSSIHLYASPKAVITQFLNLPGKNRITNVVSRVEKLGEDEVDVNYQKLLTDFAGRHRDIEKIFLENFGRIQQKFDGDLSHFSCRRKLLLGAFFTKEYSIQAAALFNPSIVPHPDQSGLRGGEQRFLMSLRATGEGHISSIIFKTGTFDGSGTVSLDKDTGYYTPLQRDRGSRYNKEFVAKRAATIPKFKNVVLDMLPESFSREDAVQLFAKYTEEQEEKLVLPGSPNEESEMPSIKMVLEILDSNYELLGSTHLTFNEKVIFPDSVSESMGMEDVRLVKFEDSGQSRYYGTYTAYNGSDIKTQLIETTDFNDFKIRTLYGAAVSDKGMALFPEKVQGKYVMISRQGGEKVNIMFSEDLYVWETYQPLMDPLYTWELVQSGNCGSPVKTDRGWLLLTHGVGLMRTYVISAVLLDLHDPTRVIGRLDKPLLVADGDEREGYVPNVVYTCGFLLHGKLLFIPYAVSDSATAFATIPLDGIMREITA